MLTTIHKLYVIHIIGKGKELPFKNVNEAPTISTGSFASFVIFEGFQMLIVKPAYHGLNN